MLNKNKVNLTDEQINEKIAKIKERARNLQITLFYLRGAPKPVLEKLCQMFDIQYDSTGMYLDLAKKLVMTDEEEILNWFKYKRSFSKKINTGDEEGDKRAMLNAAYEMIGKNDAIKDELLSIINRCYPNDDNGKKQLNRLKDKVNAWRNYTYWENNDKTRQWWNEVIGELRKFAPNTPSVKELSKKITAQDKAEEIELAKKYNDKPDNLSENKVYEFTQKQLACFISESVKKVIKKIIK